MHTFVYMPRYSLRRLTTMAKVQHAAIAASKWWAEKISNPNANL